MLHSAIWCHNATSIQLADFSRRTATETAIRILNYVQLLSRFAAPDQGLARALYTELTIDIFQSCLIICLATRNADQKIGCSASMASEHRAELLATVEATLDNYLARIPLPTMPMAPIYLSIVVAALKSHDCEELVEIRTCQYLEKIVKRLQGEAVTSSTIGPTYNTTELFTTAEWISAELDPPFSNGPIG